MFKRCIIVAVSLVFLVISAQGFTEEKEANKIKLSGYMGFHVSNIMEGRLT